MPQYILTAKQSFPLAGGQSVEKGRTIVVTVNSTVDVKNNLFDHKLGKEAVERAFSAQNIPPTASYMNYSKWDIKPFNPRF